MHKDSIRRVFAEECSHLKIDKKLIDKISAISNGFVSKNEDNLTFFGGCLTGVEKVRFTQEDEEKLFIDILEVNDNVLEESLHQLPSINKDFVVSSDVFNLSSVYLLHAIHNSHLSDELKHIGKLHVCNYLNFRYLCSRLVHHFKYPADPEVAEATYAAMSNKFLLKQLGSWLAFINNRSEDIIAKTSIHYHVIEKMDDDAGVINMINDTQGRIRDVIKNIVNIHYTNHENSTRIAVTGHTTEIDGEVILKDKVHGMENYTRYILSTLVDRNTFIKQELVNIVADTMPTMPPKHLVSTLEWFVTNYSYIQKTAPEYAVIENIIDYSFDQLLQHRDWLRLKSDLPSLVIKLRGTIMASKVSDPKLINLREVLETLIKKITGVKSDAVLAALRTGLMLYVILRAYSMKYYTGSN